MTTHKEALEAAYLAGFNASGEGYNGEYPFGDKMQDPVENRVWKKDRDNYIKEALAQPEHEKYCPICQGVGQVDTGIMESPVTICNACNGTGLKAQPELCKYGQETKSCTSSPMDCQCAIDATFAQPEQDEHVAWGVDWGKDGQQSCVSIVKRKSNGGIEVVAIEYNPTPSTPQRTWVGLTGEEELKLAQDSMGKSRHLLVAQVEAKLKEKNT